MCGQTVGNAAVAAMHMSACAAHHNLAIRADSQQAAIICSCAAPSQVQKLKAGHIESLLGRIEEVQASVAQALLEVPHTLPGTFDLSLTCLSSASAEISIERCLSGSQINKHVACMQWAPSKQAGVHSKRADRHPRNHLEGQIEQQAA